MLLCGNLTVTGTPRAWVRLSSTNFRTSSCDIGEENFQSIVEHLRNYHQYGFKSSQKIEDLTINNRIFNFKSIIDGKTEKNVYEIDFEGTKSPTTETDTFEGSTIIGTNVPEGYDGDSFGDIPAQEKLAEKAGISRSLLSNIEAPNMAYSFSLDVFYNIADALEIAPEQLICASVFPGGIINKPSSDQ